MDFGFNGCIVFIIGVDLGIGWYIVKFFFVEGVKVVIIDFDFDEFIQVVQVFDVVDDCFVVFLVDVIDVDFLVKLYQ